MKTEEYFEAEAREVKKYGVRRDSEAGLQHSLVVREYNRKLKELKKKYNIQ